MSRVLEVLIDIHSLCRCSRWLLYTQIFISYLMNFGTSAQFKNHRNKKWYLGTSQNFGSCPSRKDSNEQEGENSIIYIIYPSIMVYTDLNSLWIILFSRAFWKWSLSLCKSWIQGIKDSMKKRNASQNTFLI